MAKNYLDSVTAAFKEVHAWKAATLIVGAIAVILAYQLANQSRRQPVALLPYAVATDMGRVSVTTNGELRGTSSEYMANLASADISLLLTFTPENVLTSTRRFLNRLTISAYQAQEQKLLAAAADNKDRAVTQSFFPTKLAVSPDRTQVEVTGKLVTSLGGKDAGSTAVTYVVTYDAASAGYPQVHSVTIKNGKK